MSTEHPRRARFLARAEYRFGLVLFLLLVTFVVLMVGSSSKWLRPVTVALTGTTLLAGLFAADAPARLRRVASVIVVVAIVATASVIGLGRSGDGTAAILDAALVALAPIAIARTIVRRRVIDVQTVMAALCIYVLLGLMWGFAYTAVGSIGDTPFFAQTASATSADYLYFSFITQTTTGYGDLSAASNLGRAFAVLEALIGQLYLVTVVAVVVSRVRPRDRLGTDASASSADSAS
ncbi:MAG TPA: potassium channel family protein [Acidimicrobiales bacterium]|nr:potassium channel family protein [Acidimicrobiales bacterium]